MQHKLIPTTAFIATMILFLWLAISLIMNSVPAIDHQVSATPTPTTSTGTVAPSRSLILTPTPAPSNGDLFPSIVNGIIAAAGAIIAAILAITLTVYLEHRKRQTERTKRIQDITRLYPSALRSDTNITQVADVQTPLMLTCILNIALKQERERDISRSCSLCWIAALRSKRVEITHY